MTPSSLSIPTDSFYKFAGLLGLALVISSVIAWVNICSHALDRKTQLHQTIIPLETKTARTPAEEQQLALNSRLVEVTRSNERLGHVMVAALLGIGLAMTWLGMAKWHAVTQRREDRLTALQIERLEAEIAKIRSETAVYRST